MKQIPLTKGYFAQVDDEDFTKVNQFKWYASRGKKDPTFYAERGKRVNGKISIILLHRFVMGLTDPKIQVDHEDHDGLNCQKYNLRPATPSQNQGNRGKTIRNTSGYKGVSWHSATGKWAAKIRHLQKDIWGGLFDIPTDAAHRYDELAIELFGEFALTNANLGLLAGNEALSK